MNSVFVGGSRHVSRLPSEFRQRLDNLADAHHRILVGDANGADKAVQQYFAERHYSDVTVFCSGDGCRNNVGNWKTRTIAPPDGARGFQFHAAKDREMAREAEFGLMVWDGKKPWQRSEYSSARAGGKESGAV
jgi:hypothetical protein